MKKLVLSLSLLVVSFTVVVAQQTQAKSKKHHRVHHKMTMKKHACTAGCQEGKHAYVHGELGHTCTEACKKS